MHSGFNTLSIQYTQSKLYIRQQFYQYQDIQKYLMQGYRDYQKPKPQQKDKDKFSLRECPLGWDCQKVLMNNCKLGHDKNDKEDIQALNRIKKGKILIIADTYYKQIRPICLLQILLPIKLAPNQKVLIEIGKYYIGQFLSIQNRCAIIKVQACLGSFGNWNLQRNFFKDYLPPIFQKCKPSQNYRQKKGKINVNGALHKILQGDQCFKLRFPKVNQWCRYPFLDGSQVFYFQKNKTVQISKIRHPQYRKFSGILQIDNLSQFYFISRSQTFDQMNPNRIPQELNAQLKELTHILPYTMLKKQNLKPQAMNKINQFLKNYLVRGQFEEWPIQSRYPIISLERQVELRNFESQKQGIIYQTGIAIKSFNKNEKKESQKLANKFKLKNYQNRKHLKDKIYTVDGKNARCYDDAIYIEKRQNRDFFVEIHIADVATIIKSQSSLDKCMRQRDSTLYIKDYFQPMIHQTLRKKLSLKADGEKLAFTLSFKVSDKGLIDFGSVRFINSIIQVQQNLAHQKLEKDKQIYPELFQLSECLGKGTLIRERSLIQSGLKSELCMSRIIELSCIIPTVMFQLNFERSKEFKKKFNIYLNKIIEQKQKQMELWQDEIDKINKIQNQLKLNKKQERQVNMMLNKELDKQKQKITKKIKQELKGKSEQLKKQRKRKINNGELKKGTSQDQSEQYSDQQVQVEVVNQKQKQKQKIAQIEQPEGIIESGQILKKQKRAKALKEMKNKQNFAQTSSSQEQNYSDDSDIDVSLSQGYKITKAMGGKKFMTKIFDYFGIKLSWLRQSQIHEAFRKILSLDKGKLYQEYFRTLQITNRQHFPYIVKVAKKQARPQQKNHKKYENQKTQRSQRSQNQNNEQNKQNYLQKNSIKEDNKKIHKRYQSNNRQIKGKNTIKQLKEQQKDDKIKQQIKRQPNKNNQDKQKQDQVGQSKLKQMPDKTSQYPIFKGRQIPIMNQSMKPLLMNTTIPVKLATNEGMNQNILAQKNEKQAYLKTSPKPGQIEKIVNMIKQKVQKNKKPVFSKTQVQKLNYLVKQLQNNEKQIQQKYYDLLRNGKLINVQFNEHQNKILEENSNDFKIKYCLLKKQAISKIYQRIKKKKESPLTRKQKLQKQKNYKQQKQQDMQQQQEQNTQSQIQKSQEIRSEDQGKQRKTQNNKIIKQPFNKNKNNLKSNFRKEKAQKVVKTQIFTQKDDQIQVQKNAELNVQAEFCSSNAQITSQIKVKTNTQTELQSTIKINPSQLAIQAEQLILSNNKNNQTQGIEVENKQKNTINNVLADQPIPKKKKTKRQINKMVQQLMKPIIQQVKLKYKEKLNKINQEIKRLRLQQENAGKVLKLELEKSNIHFNLIRLMEQGAEQDCKQSQSQNQSEVDQEESLKGRRSKKKQKKKKSKKPLKKKSQKSIYSQILDNFESYADKSNYSFLRMDDEQIDNFLKKELNFKQISKCGDDDLQKMNEQAVKIGVDKFRLKWNNPIRSYESLMVMRLIKQYNWLFQGNVFPTEIIKYGDELKKIDKQINKIKDYSEDKIASGKNDKRIREANREIDYLQFYYKLKKNPDQVYTFLNISSPTPKLKRVFHQTLGDVDLQNTKFVQDMYKQVKGKVLIIKDHPIKLKVEIIQ